MRPFFAIGLLLVLLLSACGSVQTGDSADHPELSAQLLLSSGDEVFSTPRLHPYHARPVYLAAAEAAKQEKNNSVLVEAYVQLARCGEFIGGKEEMKRWFALAEKAARRDEPRGWSRYLQGRSRIEWRENKHAEMLATDKELYQYCVENNLLDRAVDAAYGVLSNVSAAEKLDWLEKARTAAELEDNRYRLYWFWYRAARVYDKLKDYPKMLDALLTARTFPRRFESDSGFIEEYLDLARAYRLNNRLEEARPWGESAVQWARIRFDSQHVGTRHDVQGFGDPVDMELPFCMIELGEIVLAQGDKARALSLFREAREIYSHTGGLHGPGSMEMFDSRIAELEK